MTDKNKEEEMEIRPLLDSEVDKSKDVKPDMTPEQWEAEVKRIMPRLLTRLQKAASNGQVLAITQVNESRMLGKEEKEKHLEDEGKKITTEITGKQKITIFIDTGAKIVF